MRESAGAPKKVLEVRRGAWETRPLVLERVEWKRKFIVVVAIHEPNARRLTAVMDGEFLSLPLQDYARQR
eukprot:5110960-Amphidinium_carterae.10